MPFDSSLPDLGGLLSMTAHNPSMNAVRSVLGRQREIIDFCVPVNPYFPTPEILERLTSQLQDLLKHYPDYASVHEEHIAAITGLPSECIVVANGSTELITALCQNAVGAMVTTVPTFGRWTDLPTQLGKPLHFVAHRREQAWRIDVHALVAEVQGRSARSLVICNPNNPTGAWFEHHDIEILVQELTQVDTIVVDESFIDFSGLESAGELASHTNNLVIVKSLGKSLGWHGMRLGYAVASPERAAALRSQLPWWNINGIAAFVLKELANGDQARQAYTASFESIDRDRAYLQQELGQLDGLTAFPSRANFVYVELASAYDGKALRTELLERHGVYVRECSNKIGSSKAFLRLAVLPPPQTDALIRALKQVLASPTGHG